jgi:hypothetical protein
MYSPQILLKPTEETTRLLMTCGNRELLRAVLPSPLACHPQAAATLLDGLSLWLQQPLRVVLSADAAGASSALGLCDGFGFGNTTVHYQVEVVNSRKRRQSLGSFRDLYQLRLRGF